MDEDSKLRKKRKRKKSWKSGKSGKSGKYRGKRFYRDGGPCL